MSAAVRTAAPTPPLPAEVVRRAVRTVAAHSRTSAECRMYLAMLGIGGAR